MIESPIQYKAKTEEKIEALKTEQKLRQGFWEDDEVKPIKKELKDYYKLAQEYTCPYCLTSYPVRSNRGWDLDHIVPVSNCPHFMFEARNLCISCIECNIAKSDKSVIAKPYPKNYPQQSTRFRIAHPHYDQYSDHIRKIEPHFYFARTDKGRHTIDFCNLHRFAYDDLVGEDALSRLPKAIESWNTVMKAASAQNLQITVSYDSQEGARIETRIR